MEQSNKRLQELKGSDYKIVDEQPDINGWPLYTSDHQKIGKVEDLLFDTEAQKVRYIIADLDGNDLDLDDKEVLIPIGIAQLHEDDDEVIVPGISAANLGALPAYNDDRDLTDSDEQAIISVLSGNTDTTNWSSANTERYNHAHFDDRNFYRESIQPTVNDQLRNADERDTNYGTDETNSRGIRLRSRRDNESGMPDKPVW